MEQSIWCASGPELSILATTIAIYISELYDTADLSTISTFIVSVGDMLALLATQKARCEVSIKAALDSSNAITNNLFSTTQNT